MVDKVSKAVRTKTMSSIKSKNTALELTVDSSLYRKGFRYRKYSSSLPGRPDISIIKYKVVIFIDSCFWHGCPDHCRMPSSNTDYWRPKIERNKKRDNEINQYYINNNWNLMRVWEHDLKSDFDNTINELVDFLKPR